MKRAPVGALFGYRPFNTKPLRFTSTEQTETEEHQPQRKRVEGNAAGTPLLRAVTGIADAVAIAILLVSIGNERAVIETILNPIKVARCTTAASYVTPIPECFLAYNNKGGDHPTPRLALATCRAGRCS